MEQVRHDAAAAAARPSSAPVTAGPDLAGGRSGGVAGNARLTGSTAALLLLLFAVEGATIPFIRPMLSVHVFVGMLLVPPAALKMGSTGYKILRYYTGNPAYRQAGPPPVVRRLLGPLVIVATVAVLASGIAVVLTPPESAGTLLQLHKASFIVWFGVLALHVLIHIRGTAQSVAAEWTARRPTLAGRRQRGYVAGRRQRAYVLLFALAFGVVLAVISLSWVGPWR